MSDANFDKEISQLYQQRKRGIDTPEINLSKIKVTKRRRYSAFQMLSILFFGGAASFGILAVISHLSGQQMVKPASNVVIPLRVIELTEQPQSPEATLITVLAPLMPKKPPPTHPKLEQEKMVNTSKLSANLTVVLPHNVVNIMPSASIEQPNLSLVPIYQVLPKYSIKASTTKQEGMVKLSYSITSTGKVHSIIIGESNVTRELNRAAKKALSKWQYQPGEYEQTRYEIIFDFMLNKKK
ncbi:MAG: TonB family protein [Colwellia sp.]|nr:TonB family protein [Colwellia sp.]